MGVFQTSQLPMLVSKIAYYEANPASSISLNTLIINQSDPPNLSNYKLVMLQTNQTRITPGPAKALGNE
jgi:hypothetical protein